MVTLTRQRVPIAPRSRQRMQLRPPAFRDDYENTRETPLLEPLYVSPCSRCAGGFARHDIPRCRCY